MDAENTDINELHWLMGMLHSINVGLVVIDRSFHIQVWNNFMQDHSGMLPSQVIGKDIFKIFKEIPENWFMRKALSVFMLENRSFTTWEQRPYLFKFDNYRPITGTAEFMYQNTTFIPLASTDGTVNHVGIIVYDVTDMAISTLELEEANAELGKLSRTDRLTQLYNRGYWEECLIQEYLRVKRTHQPASLIMFDIDHFKKVNDTYGHQAGDEVIRQTSEALRNIIRETDIPGRYGGEEFGIILIDTEEKNALVLAERLRKKIESTTVHHEGMDINYTISLGIAGITDGIDDYKQWLEHSDQALYQSKESGRNKSIIYKK